MGFSGVVGWRRGGLAVATRGAEAAMIRFLIRPVGMITEADQAMMRRAIKLAASVPEFLVHPNPRVGCVIAAEGKVWAEGFHKQNGGPHAEVHAIQSLPSPLPERLTLYVTLEPCSTKGRTGACCQRIQEISQIRRVVVGTVDPNPDHNGQGIDLLRLKALDVETGCLEKNCRDLNPGFNQRMQR